MYFEDMCLIILKSLVWTIFIAFLFAINIFNYDVGVGFCEMMNIPKDFTLTMISPGMAINITITLFVIEMICLFHIIKILKRISIVDDFLNFICNINI